MSGALQPLVKTLFQPEHVTTWARVGGLGGLLEVQDLLQMMCMPLTTFWQLCEGCDLMAGCEQSVYHSETLTLARACEIDTQSDKIRSCIWKALDQLALQVYACHGVETRMLAELSRIKTEIDNTQHNARMEAQLRVRF